MAKEYSNVNGNFKWTDSKVVSTSETYSTTQLTRKKQTCQQVVAIKQNDLDEAKADLQKVEDLIFEAKKVGLKFSE